MLNQAHALMIDERDNLDVTMIGIETQGMTDEAQEIGVDDEMIEIKTVDMEIDKALLTEVEIVEIEEIEEIEEIVGIEAHQVEVLIEVLIEDMEHVEEVIDETINEREVLDIMINTIDEREAQDETNDRLDTLQLNHDETAEARLLMELLRRRKEMRIETCSSILPPTTSRLPLLIVLL